jgi:transcriptional regulator with XRE-family HTH domain
MDINFIYKEFGRRLRDARTAAELTQQALAEQVGLNRSSITNIEKGRQRFPLHLLFSLASAVGVPPAALLPERKNIPESGYIDKKQLEKESLKQDQEDYITTLVTSGMTRKKEREDKK